MCLAVILLWSRIQWNANVTRFLVLWEEGNMDVGVVQHNLVKSFEAKELIN